MHLILGRENRGKVVLIITTLFMWLLMLIAFRGYGYEKTWQLWKVPTVMPSFIDFRLIPGSAESFRNGFEPTIKNPGDPRERIFNYPAFWRIFFYTGITLNDTVWIVVSMLVLFFVGVFLFPQAITVLDALAMLFVIFSPASMLLYERGNVDLIVFFLCAMTILATDYSPYTTSALLVFAMIVKLYPFFGVIVLLKESKLKFIALFLGCFAVLAAYLYVTSKSVKASWDLTMRGDHISYGADVLFLRYNQYFSKLLGISEISPAFKYGPIFLAFILIIFAGVAGIINRNPLTSSSPRNLAAFRMGASIYVGTFLLGNNWDYRLAFLILVMPQILQWIRQPGPEKHKIMAIVVLALIYISCWHFIVWYAPSLAGIQEFIFIADEVANWMLVMGFSYLLFASVPDWVKDQLMFLLPGKHLFTA